MTETQHLQVAVVNLIIKDYTSPETYILIHCHIYYSKFAKDQLFDIAYFSPIANDTPVRGPHYCVLKLSICHVQLAIIIFNSLKAIIIFITNTQSNTVLKKVCITCNENTFGVSIFLIKYLLVFMYKI